MELCRFWLNQGWKFRRIHERPKIDQNRYKARVEHELKRIKDKGFIDYFLVTSDIVRWAKNQKIAVGPARGSAASSLVCWLLRITEIDPMQHPLMRFDRFIDPERSDMPDVDLDFDDERRHEVFAYAEQKYGVEHVAHIQNIVRYAGKNSIDDIARIYRFPKWKAEAIKDLVTDRSEGDARADKTLEDAFTTFPRIKAIVKEHPQFTYAVRLEGNRKNTSVHAAGLIISRDPITETCAVYIRTTSKGEQLRALAYDKRDAEYLGMLKLDLLGLSTMGMIGRALDTIGMDLEDLYRIPLDDRKTMRAFQKGDVTGIFQFEGRTTRRVCDEVKPRTFQHLSDINALARPGPLFAGIASNYVVVRHDPDKREYIHPVLDKITDATYGQLVYQEQITDTLRDVGGFQPAQTNRIRKIIGKKLGTAQFNELYGEFESGAKRLHGMKPEVSKRIWHFMLSSASYSFNYGHSASYTALGFWSQWLKQNHPTAFYAAQLAKVGDGKQKLEKRARLLQDAMNSEKRYPRPPQRILPPTILSSGKTWAPDGKNTLRAGLTQITGIADKIADDIVSWRDDKLMSYPDPDAIAELGLCWADMLPSVADGGVHGIGAAKVAAIEEFEQSDDPFGLDRIPALFTMLRADVVQRGNPFGLPTPTHTSRTLPENGTVFLVCVPRKRSIRDYVEDQRTRTGKTAEEIRAEMKHPELATSCTLYCYDEYSDEIYVRFNRMKFPEFAEAIDSINLDEDAIIVKGQRIKKYGSSIYVDKMWIVDLSEDEQEEEE